MGKMHAEGVTLIELLVTLAVVAVIVAAGVPALRDFLATNRMSAAVNDLITSIHLARSEAITREAPTTLCPSANWDSPAPTCNPGGNLADGWIVLVGRVGSPIVVQRHEPLSNGIALARDFVDSIDFSTNGLPANANAAGEFNLLLCDDRGDHDAGGGVAAGRWINLRGRAGRPRIYRQRADVQSSLGGC